MRQITIPPFRFMLIKRPALAPTVVGQILLRLRCEACKRPPTRVWLIVAAEHAAHAGNGLGGPPPWSLILLGDGA